MIVEKDKVVSLTYELRLDNAEGNVVESLNPDSPLTFLYGNGQLLPKFEENIDGFSVGDSFDFNLKNDEAYGEMNKDAIVDVPIDAFEIDGKIDESLLEPGTTIPMQDKAGNRLHGTVQKVSDSAVKMDFNHPLAGKELYFKGEITEIRDATNEELQHGHVHKNEDCDDGCENCNDEGNC